MRAASKVRAFAFLVMIGLAIAIVAEIPGARGLTWTQTSAADFLAGQRSNVDVLASGDLRLSSVASAWSREGVVLDVGPPGSSDSEQAGIPFVMKDGSTYRMWYRGSDGSRFRLMYATSSDGVAWTKQGVAIDVLVPPYDFDSVNSAFVVKEGGLYRMWYSGGYWSGGPGGIYAQVYYATSMDASTWTLGGIALDLGALGTWDDSLVWMPSVVRDANGRYWMYYAGWDGTAGGWNYRIGVATSTNGVGFNRVGIDPILTLGPTGSWDDALLTSPFVLIGAPWRMWYSGSDGTAFRIGFATSPDGYNWTKALGNPAYREGAPGSWDGTAVGPASILEDGTDTFLYYTGSDGTSLRTGRARQIPGFAAAGWFESAVLDSGAQGTVWDTLAANGTVNLFSAMFLRTRSGDVSVPESSWSAWSSAVAPGTSAIVSPRARYLQVRVEMSTASSSYSPIFGDFAVTYSLNSAVSPTPLSPIGGTWVTSSSLDVTWAYSDSEGDLPKGFRVQISNRADFATVSEDSGVVLSTGSSWQSPPVADGDWYWRVQTMDGYGQWSPYSGAAYVRVDTVSPVTQVGYMLPPGSVDGLPLINSTNRVVLFATDSGSGVVRILYSVNGGPSAVYTAPFLPAAHGVVDLGFGATDAAGNLEYVRSIVLLVDDPPVVYAVSPADSVLTNSSAVTVAWTYTDPDGDLPSGYEVQLSDDPSFVRVGYSSGNVPGGGHAHSFLRVGDGSYFWRVRSEDAFGVWSAWSTPRRVRIDSTPPGVTARYKGAAVPSGIFVILVGEHLELNASDSGSGVSAIEYAIDGGSWTTYSGPIQFGTAGRHVLSFRARDVAGNLGGTQFVAFDVVYPFNWTPIVAFTVAVLLAAVGAVFAARRPEGLRPSKTYVWALLSGGATVLEALVGAYSLVTGDLSMPPWFGTALTLVLGIAVAGIAEIVVGWRALSPPKIPQMPQTMAGRGQGP